MPAADLSPYLQPSGTGADGTKFDNALNYLQGLLNGLDNNNFASGKIFDPAKLMQNAAVDGDALVWDNTNSKWVPASTLTATKLRFPGQELGYQERTTNITINTVAEAAATTIVTAPAVTVDGSTGIFVCFYTPAIAFGGGGITSGINVWEGSTDKGRLYDGSIVGSVSANFPGGLMMRKFTPAAGTYTYSIRGWCGATNMVVQCGAGGAGAALPAFIRVIRA